MATVDDPMGTVNSSIKRTIQKIQEDELSEEYKLLFHEDLLDKNDTKKITENLSYKIVTFLSFIR